MDILKVVYLLRISSPCLCMPFIFVRGDFPDTEQVFHFYVVSSVILFFCDFWGLFPHPKIIQIFFFFLLVLYDIF